MKRFLLLFFTFLFFVIALPTVFAQTFPKPTGFVNDSADLFSRDFEQRLNDDITRFEASTSAELAVVTVPNLQGTTIDDYAARLFEYWKIGKDKKDNGVLVLIAKEEREARIEVGYGLESVITDARAGRIIRQEMIPEFRNGNYEQGTENAVIILQKHIRGETVIEEKPSSDNSNWGWISELVPFLFFGVVYLGSFLARTKSFFAGGIIGAIVGVIIGLFIGGLIAILSSAFIIALIGLLLDFILSRNYQKLQSQHKRTDWWGSRGGFYGGGSSGGGGFGGFGGGSSGGGGASGRW